MEEGEAEDPTREWIAFYAMAVEEGTPSSSYPKTCHIWHNPHRRLTSCGADSLWPMTCSLSTRGSTTFLDYCPEFWVQVSVEVSLEATKPARQGVVGYMCRSCGGDKWPVAAAAASWSACQSKSSCCHVRYKRSGWTVCATPRLSRDIATFIRRLTNCVSLFRSNSRPPLRGVVQPCHIEMSANSDRNTYEHVRGGTPRWVGDEAEMLMHIRHSTPMLDLVAHRIDEHVPYKYFFDQVKAFVS